MKQRIIVLGNEFVEEDSLAKKICEKLPEFEISHIKDSFKLMEELFSNEEVIVIDVVKGLEGVRELKLEEIDSGKIISAHDFDAGFVFRLNNKEIKIIGIPMIERGDEEKIISDVRNILNRI